MGACCSKSQVDPSPSTEHISLNTKGKTMADVKSSEPPTPTTPTSPSKRIEPEPSGSSTVFKTFKEKEPSTPVSPSAQGSEVPASNKGRKAAGQRKRTIRVFFSSPFGGMEEEREHMTKRFFPQLQHVCEKAGYFFIPIDLRWGITAEAAEDAQVMSICLREIEYSDIFVGMYGQRYGWHGQNDPLLQQNFNKAIAASQRFSWIDQFRERSVTEIEWRHGLIQSSKPAFLFYREAAWDAKKAEEHPEVGFKFKVESEEAKTLRDNLFKDVLSDTDIIANMTYSDPMDGAEKVYHELFNYFQELMKASSASELDRQFLQHEAFMMSRSLVYVGGEKYFNQIDEHLATKKVPLVITGDSGGGKSSLLANWILKRQNLNDEKEILLYHFIGASSESTLYENILRRFTGELKNEAHLEDELPTDPKALSSKFPGFLQKASDAGYKVVMVIDALNQLEDVQIAHSLSWLPTEFPHNCQLIVSTLKQPQIIFKELEERKWQKMIVNPLNQEEQEMIVKELLSKRGKEFSDEQITKVVGAPQTKNPLFLSVLLEELCSFGDFFHLDEKMDDYLRAPDAVGLFEKFLERLEQDFPFQGRSLVEGAMVSLYSSRNGLSESELNSILEIPAAHWSPLFFALQKYLVLRSGLIGFFHDQLRQAVERKYLKKSETKKKSHLHVARFFQKKLDDDLENQRPISQRVVDELPWLLDRAGDIQNLKLVISNLPVFERLQMSENKYDLYKYWRTVGWKAEIVGPAYLESVKSFEKTLSSTNNDQDLLATKLNNVATFLREAGFYPDAVPLYEKVLEIRKNIYGEEHSSVGSGLNGLALLYKQMGKFPESEEMYKEALRIREKTLGPNHAQVGETLNNLALLYRHMDRLSEAEPLYLRSLEIRKKVYGPRSQLVGQSLNNLALLYKTQGKVAEAEKMYYEALEIRQAGLGKNHPEVAQTMNNIALLYKHQGKFELAEKLYLQSLEIKEKSIGPDHPDVARSLNNLGLLYKDQKKLREAEQFYTRCLDIRIRALGPEHPDTLITLGNIAEFHNASGDKKKALEMHHQVLDARIKVLGPNHSDIAITCSNMAIIYDELGDLSKALKYAEMCAAIRERNLGPNHARTKQAYKTAEDIKRRM